MAEKGRGGCAVVVIKFLFRFYAICVPCRGKTGVPERRTMRWREEVRRGGGEKEQELNDDV